MRHSVGLLFLYGAMGSHLLFASRVASGRYVPTAAASCVLDGVVSSLAEPNSWRSGVVLVGSRSLPTPIHIVVICHMPRRVSVCMRCNCTTLLSSWSCAPYIPALRCALGPCTPCLHVVHVGTVRTFMVSVGVVHTSAGGVCSLVVGAGVLRHPPPPRATPTPPGQPGSRGQPSMVSLGQGHGHGYFTISFLV